MKILILNGPNLNLIEKRNSSLYGDMSLKKIEELLKSEFPSYSFEFFQSNIEGELVDIIQKAENNYDGLIINPGGYAHTSVSIKDALDLCKLPKIEVHLSNLSTRESFRQTLITASGCNGCISGFKEFSYVAAVFILSKLIKSTIPE
jgi:3-dehydroquinate dehydratase-2